MKRALLTLLLFFAAFSFSAAQNYVSVPVTVSKEKVSISGKIYWTHKVLEKQTLYSISKAYNVPVKAIMEANPALSEGLKAGNLIFIPCDAITKAIAKDGTYDTSNKVRADTLPEGYSIHTVRWFENLSSIAARSGVSEEAIIEVNHLSGKRVSRRQKLLIPPPGYIPGQFRNEKEDKGNDEEEKDSIGGNDFGKIPEEEMKARLHHISGIKKFSKYNPAKISMILPLNSESVPNQNYMDYYCGTLIALEDLKKDGLNAELTVWDNESSSVKELVSSGQLRNSDLIIGPVLASDVADMAVYCDSFHIPFVSPMDPRASYVISKSPNLFQVPTSESARIDNAINSLGYSPSDRVLLIYERGGNDTSLVRMYRETLDRDGIRYKSYSYDILEGRSVRNNIEALMNKSGLQKVIVASENEAFVLDCLRNLNLSIDFGGYALEVWGQPKWRNFETLDPTYCHKVNLHLSLPYFVDYSNSKVKSFVSRYRDLYGTEPSPFSFQGYDIAYYFISALNTMGKNLENYVEYYPMTLLQSKMKFHRSGRHGGFINTATKEVEYKSDYRIE
ncbi:MAG: LysM peptidoglycan-binding domain-containing protein [Bacteroidales bacterium]|jgi:LysM repeat protein/ABC-type branched-subunit amino acid transport system substrate-binding protein|nr:LysM peptidoglycan-binding domain-containing protein [Bacteroidales bacterium]MCI2122039.1 LysM peptidoglycan-binding domain-containing protein [Bacteroidales bacterium]MCI2145336.1 LysM peptidoglycan-binding domain-containing protein [Bacteroidales bacterium]